MPPSKTYHLLYPLLKFGNSLSFLISFCDGTEVGYNYNPSGEPDPFANIRVTMGVQRQAEVSSTVNISPPPAPSASPKFGH